MTSLSPEQKRVKPKRVPKIDRLLALMKERAPKLPERKFHIEYALFLLLEKHRDELPVLNWYFHKCFRQCDVVEGDKGATDMMIWHLLCASELFWECYTEVNRRPRKEMPVKRLKK